MTNQGSCYVVQLKRLRSFRIFKSSEDGNDMFFSEPFLRGDTGSWIPARPEWLEFNCKHDIILKDATFSEVIAFIVSHLTEEGDHKQAQYWLSIL